MRTKFLVENTKMDIWGLCVKREIIQVECVGKEAWWDDGGQVETTIYEDFLEEAVGRMMCI
jgi:hypothetical protein